MLYGLVVFRLNAEIPVLVVLDCLFSKSVNVVSHFRGENCLRQFDVVILPVFSTSLLWESGYRGLVRFKVRLRSRSEIEVWV